MHVLMLWLTFNTGSLNIEILSTIIIDTTYLFFLLLKNLAKKGGRAV